MVEVLQQSRSEQVLTTRLGELIGQANALERFRNHLTMDLALITLQLPNSAEAVTNLRQRVENPEGNFIVSENQIDSDQRLLSYIDGFREGC